MTLPTYLGIDIGTSSLKTLLVDAGGRVLARGSSSYSARSPLPGRFEQDAEEWPEALAECTAQIPADLREHITTIAAVGQVPTLVLVDAAGIPVRPAITWQDSRATAEAAALESRFGDSTALLGTPLPWAPSQLPAKIMWVAEHEPDAAAGTRWILQPKDYLNHQLTGVVGTDPWSSKGICEVLHGRPATQILSACGWDAERVPPTSNPWDVLGTVTERAAVRFGLPVGARVASGWTDAMASIMGVGGFDKPTGVVLTGTSEIVGASARTARAMNGLYLVPSTVSPLALSYGPTQSSGASLNWIAGVCGLNVGDALALGATATGALPTFVPYLDGERAPLWNPEVRGLFLGLSSRHTAAHLIRAVATGVALSARHVLGLAIESTGDPIGEVNVGGRGAAHPLWSAVRAAALGMPLRLHTEANLSALGAVMVAAMADGADPAELHLLRSEPEVLVPTGDDVAAAAEDFARYRGASAISIEWSDL